MDKKEEKIWGIVLGAIVLFILLFLISFVFPEEITQQIQKQMIPLGLLLVGGTFIGVSVYGLKTGKTFLPPAKGIKAISFIMTHTPDQPLSKEIDRKKQPGKYQSYIFYYLIILILLLILYIY